MSKIDQKYIDALETFTESLEKIVETLKEQQKSGVADVVNDFLKSPMDNLVTVVQDLKDISQKGFSELKNDNKEILKKIESIKNQKDSSMFDKIEDPKNKNKIVDGIKVVVLIAAGILALGLAFKIIGKVDFLSVIALSTSILIISQTFSKISDIKNLKYTEILKIASFMPIMALGIAISGIILKKMPVISFQQGLSILFIGGTLGVASYMILKSVSKMSTKSLLIAPFIPFLLPLIALGIVKSSEILPATKSISFRTVIDVALIGLAMGVATFAIGLAIKHIKNFDLAQMIMIPIMLPLIAKGLVLSSNILKDFDPIKDPLKLLVGSTVIGLSMLMFVPTVWMVSKLKFKDVLIVPLMLPLIATSIVLSSKILNEFNPIKDPIKLLIGTATIGLSILVFSGVIWALDKLKIDSKTIIKGGISILAVSAIILLTSYMFLLLPDNMKYPSIMWSLGVGLSLITFGLSVAELGIASLVPTFWIGFPALLAVAASIVAVSHILQKGKYDGNYPSLRWSLGVGAALLGFSIAIIVASAAGIVGAVGKLFTGGKDPLLKVAESIVRISHFIQLGKYSGNYPTAEWSKGVGTALILFASATILSSASGLAKKIVSFFSGDKDPLLTIAKSVVAISHEIQLGKYSGNVPSVTWSVGVGALLLEFMALTIAASAQGLIKAVASLFTGDKDPLFTIAKSITSISRELVKGDYSKYPDSRWVKNVSYSLFKFSNMAKELSSGNLFDRVTGHNPLLSIAQTMSAISIFLSIGKWDSKIPDKKTTDSLVGFISNLLVVAESWDYDVDDAVDFNVGITNVANGLNKLQTIKGIPNNLSNGYTLFFNSLKSLPKLTATDSKIIVVKTLTDMFTEMAQSLNKVNVNLQKFVEYYNKLDIKKLDQLSASVDKSSVALGIKKPDQDKGVFGNIISKASSSFDNSKEKYSVSQQQSDVINKKQERFYDDISEIRRLLSEMRDDVNKPSKAGSFHK